MCVCVCVCVCACVCVCVCVRVCVFTCVQYTYKCTMCVGTYIYQIHHKKAIVHTYVHIPTHIMYIHRYMSIHIYLHMYVQHVSEFHTTKFHDTMTGTVHTHIRTYMYVRMHVCAGVQGLSLLSEYRKQTSYNTLLVCTSTRLCM